MADYLRVTLAEFKSLKSLADRALAQVGDADFFKQIDPESNSLAHIVKHVSGNLRSRWTDFLTTDGEKPDRNRDGEFERSAADSREKIMMSWEDGWARCVDTLESLRQKDLDTKITIRGQGMSAETATQRSLAHTAQHVGQIVYLAKHLAGAGWQTLSVPKKRA